MNASFEAPNEGGEPLPHPAPEGPAREAVLWLVLVTVVIGLAYLNVLALRALPAEPPPPGAKMDLVLQAKYAVGTADLLRRAPAVGAAASGQDDAPAAVRAAIGPRLSRLAEAPRDRVAVALVRAETGEADRALRELERLADDESLDPQVRREARAFYDFYARDVSAHDPAGGGRIDDDLVASYGWFAELALADGARGPVREARRVAIGLAVAVVVLLLLLGAGLVVGLWFWKQAREGRLRSGYRRLVGDDADPLPRLSYLETLLVFLAGVTVVGGLSAWVVEATGSTWGLLLNWAVLPVLLWPVLRGREAGELRRALGWTGGGPWWREAGAGLVAYVGAMPILALGLLLSLLSQRFVEEAPHHPIVDWVSESGPAGWVTIFVLASVWAPLLEESVFRGAFYHYLRARLGFVAAALVVGVIFAAIHPQGLAGLPFLTALAFSLALIREWRGSLWASITVHAVHNGLATLFLVLVLA